MGPTPWPSSTITRQRSEGAGATRRRGQPGGTGVQAYRGSAARSYAERTWEVDVRPLRERFLDALDSRSLQGAWILDVGCGPGRDLAAFRQRGAFVEGLDPSPDMARLARAASGARVHVCPVQMFRAPQRFDGIWAMASLLHVPALALPETFRLLAGALRPAGILYASFKVGGGERTDRQRRFTDLDEAAALSLLHQTPPLQMGKMWRSMDQRGRARPWLNLLLRRR